MSIDLGSAVGRILIDSSGVEQGTKQAQKALGGFATQGAAGLAKLGVAMAGAGRV